MMDSKRLGFPGPGPHTLTLGKSFYTNGSSHRNGANKHPEEVFHSIRYDFKPASVEQTVGSVTVGDDNKTVNISIQGSGSDQTTNYR